jgi:hypothetical protein
MGYEQTYDPDPQQQVDDLTRGHIAEVHTAIPGRIESYDATKCLANVKPLLKRRFNVDGADGEIVQQDDEYPVITAVPVAFPRGGGFCIAWPLTEGDPCLLVFSERSLDAYLDSDGASVIDPDDARTHDVTDAVCIPGMTTKANPIPNAPTAHIVIGKENGAAQLRVTASQVQAIGDSVRLGAANASQALALATETKSRLDQIQAAFDAHMHPTAAVGPPSPPLTPIGALGAIASGKVFANG